MDVTLDCFAMSLNYFNNRSRWIQRLAL